MDIFFSEIQNDVQNQYGVFLGQFSTSFTADRNIETLIFLHILTEYGLKKIQKIVAKPKNSKWLPNST
jgi:hypothetical protein